MNGVRQIDLLTLLIEIAKKWKPILIGGVVFFVLLVGITFARSMGNNANATPVQNENALTEEELEELEELKAGLESDQKMLGYYQQLVDYYNGAIDYRSGMIDDLQKEISTFTEKIGKEEEELEEYLRLDIDSEKVPTVSFSIIVSADEKKLTDMTEHMVSGLKMVSNSLATALKNVVLNQVAESEGMSPTLLGMLVSVRVDYQTVTISTRGVDDAFIQRVSDAFIEAIPKAESDLGSILNGYSLSITDKTVYHSSFNEIETAIENLKAKIAADNKELFSRETSIIDCEKIIVDCEKAILDSNKAYAELEKQINDNRELLQEQQESQNTSDVEVVSSKLRVSIKSLLKRGVVGFIIGAFLMAVGWGCYNIYSNRIYTVKDIKMNTDINVIGRVSYQNKKGIDRILCSLQDNLVDATGDESLHIIKENLMAMTANREYFITSELSQNILVKLKEDLGNVFPEARLEAKSDIINNAGAIKNVSEFENVILVVKLGLTKMPNLYAQIEKCKQLGKEVMGCIIIEA